MTETINWQPEPDLYEKLAAAANQRGQSLETTIAEAVSLYLETIPVRKSSDRDPIIGLFAGSPDLATRSEDILQEEITEKSGWTWKESRL